MSSEEEARQSRRAVVAFLAVGTRGDVQPCAILAARLAERGKHLKVFFITNRKHRSFLEPPLASAGVCVEFLSLAPASAKKNNDSGDGQQAVKDEREEEILMSDEQHREECIHALETTLDCSILGPSGGSSQRVNDGRGALIVINLFALEGWHIAEALGCPCAVVSPCVVPYTPPSSFAKRFKRAYPGLYDFLSNREDGKPASWREVEHWLWPVFTERWGRWRSERLHLNEVPFLSCMTDAAQHLGGGTPTTRPTPLIYGCSPSITQVPGYWPDTVHVCGFWFPPDDWEHDVHVPQHLMTDFFLSSAGKERSVIAITLSTIFDMGLLGDIDEAKHIINVLRSALKTSGLKGMFIMSKDSCLESAWRSLDLNHSATVLDKKRKTFDDNDAPAVNANDEGWVGGDETVQGYVGSFPFQQLFPMCLGVLHHGGVGTTAAALRAGIPQMICPALFDQFYWAERMSWLGVAPAALKASDFIKTTDTTNDAASNLEKKLSSGFDFLKLPDSHRSAQDLQQMVLREHDDGAVDCAVSTLESVIGDVVLPNATPGGVRTQQMLELPNGWHVACGAKAEAFYLFNEIVEEQTYFRHGIEPVPDGVVIDVGANIGMFLLATNSWLRSAGLRRSRKYLAIEPLEPNVTAFKTNMWMHKASVGVDVIRCGLTNEANASRGSADFTYFPSMPGNSTMYPKEKILLQREFMKPEYFESSEVIACPVATITSVLQLHLPGDITRIDLLKVDAEGSELEILEGLSDEYWRMIRQIVVEVHDVDGRVAKIEELLKCKRYNTFIEAHEACARAFLVYAHRQLDD
mmetsp:Transcript_7608/g.19376  ORF Transcript_7608/g.19376 Transcript_7608/m.19376 type:complete len:806 (-) Transcript_7608:109-2526(-)